MNVCPSGERFISSRKTGKKVRDEDACKEVRVVLREENVLIFKYFSFSFVKNM